MDRNNSRRNSRQNSRQNSHPDSGHNTHPNSHHNTHHDDDRAGCIVIQLGNVKDQQREARAQTQPMQVIPLPDNEWLVYSCLSKQTYRVTCKKDQDWLCTCPDHHYRHVECKHIKRVKIDMYTYEF